eukprot:CAMPEP_0197837070 /NCGR_PEP_ID=MMETSP1437-20131217/31032_1 /TAXON_ID=49252 ORGANISM="Eucampia antarctica, Strain CCMP1452" /NCGR_SAMPLE_ID=MMETSP1437 /ASSEMBLY_ACC=CAM_ASM_001096 /LENGTH=46 /DNA_ID= /DNA_START= /DNA_END= /DNA_ORIENTATION=
MTSPPMPPFPPSGIPSDPPLPFLYVEDPCPPLPPRTNIMASSKKAN